MGTVTIEISGSDRAAVQETYRRIEMMFEVVDAHDTDAEPDRRYLEIQPPGDTAAWTIEELPQDGSHPATLLIHGPAGEVVVPLIEMQAVREALATAAAGLAMREVKSKQGKN